MDWANYFLIPPMAKSSGQYPRYALAPNMYGARICEYVDEWSYTRFW